MKFLKIFFITLAVIILVLIIGIIIFIKTFDVNRFKPQIIGQANKILGRQVDFEKATLDISLKQGVSLKISNLVVSDDPAFQKGGLLAVKDISLAVDLLGYIFKKKINVSGILIDSPRVTIIRQKDGVINFQSFAEAIQKGQEGIKSAPAQAALVIPAVFISYLKGNSGTVVFIDRTFEPEMALEIFDLDFSFNKISLAQPFPFVAEAAVLSANKNIKLEGEIQINLKTSEVVISGLKATADLSRVLLDKISTFFPMTKDVILPVGLKGIAEARLAELIIGPKGITGLEIDALLKDGMLQFKEIALPINGITADAKVTESKVILNKVSAGIGEGVISASGLIDDYLSAQGYGIEAIVSNLKIQELVAWDKSPVKAEGFISGKIKINGRGFDPQAFASSLAGQADMSITGARLKDLNVLRMVLDKISVIIPGLAQKLETSLPERYKQRLTEKDTVFSDIKLPVTIGDGRLVIKDTFISADEFLFKGAGEAGFDGVFSLEGSFLIPEELSAAMVEKNPELQYLLNDSRQIYIPLRVSGKAAGELEFNVDAEYVARRLVEDQAKKQIFKVLDKVIGGKEEPDATGQDKPQDTSSGDKTAAEEIIGDVLHKIFK